MSLVAEMISVPEVILVPRKVRTLMLCEAMPGEAMPGKPSEMATATSEMPATTVAATASTMRGRGGRRERQDAGQNQTDK